MSNNDEHGFSRGLTNYGDRDFSLYLRRSFAKSMGYSDAMLARPIVGIVNTASAVVSRRVLHHSRPVLEFVSFIFQVSPWFPH